MSRIRLGVSLEDFVKTYQACFIVKHTSPYDLIHIKPNTIKHKVAIQCQLKDSCLAGLWLFRVTIKIQIEFYETLFKCRFAALCKFRTLFAL